MSQQGEDLENEFICLDVICKEKNCVIVTTEEMFHHRQHKDVICFKDIRSDIDKNAIMVDKFLSDHDLNKYLTYVDDQMKNFTPESRNEAQKFLDQTKMYKQLNNFSKLTQDYVNTQRLKDIFKFIRANSMDELQKLKGNFSFLKNIQKLPDLTEQLDEPFQKAKKDIIEFKKEIDLKIQAALLKKLEKKNGYAEYEYKNGDTYKGQWKNDLRNGEGETVSLNGDRFKGMYVDGQRCGYGEYFWTQKQVYRGEWKNDQMNGQGELTQSDGDRYKGSFSNGKKHGQGEYYWANKDVFKGQWENDAINGKGETVYANENTYQGNSKNGKKEGYGEYKWNNGDIYKGSFQNDRKHGQGEYISSNGNRYIGSYVEDKKNGQGEYYWNNGEVYKGQWQNGIQLKI